MFHRESGVFKTSYAADMALYPLPIARWAVAALAGLFIVIAPLTLGAYPLSILNLILIAVVGALGLNILVGYTGQISIGTIVGIPSLRIKGIYLAIATLAAQLIIE